MKEIYEELADMLAKPADYKRLRELLDAAYELGKKALPKEC
jgi:hypothetical protein